MCIEVVSHTQLTYLSTTSQKIFPAPHMLRYWGDRPYASYKIMASINIAAVNNYTSIKFHHIAHAIKILYGMKEVCAIDVKSDEHLIITTPLIHKTCKINTKGLLTKANCPHTHTIQYKSLNTCSLSISSWKFLADFVVTLPPKSN